MSGSGARGVRSSSFAAMGAYGFVSSNLVGSGEPERLDGVSITYEALDAPTVTVGQLAAGLAGCESVTDEGGRLPSGDGRAWWRRRGDC